MLVWRLQVGLQHATRGVGKTPMGTGTPQGIMYLLANALCKLGLPQNFAVIDSEDLDEHFCRYVVKGVSAYHAEHANCDPGGRTGDPVEAFDNRGSQVHGSHPRQAVSSIPDRVAQKESD